MSRINRRFTLSIKKRNKNKNDAVLSFAYSLRKEILENKSDWSKQKYDNKLVEGFVDALEEIIFNFGNEELEKSLRLKTCIEEREL